MLKKICCMLIFGLFLFGMTIAAEMMHSERQEYTEPSYVNTNEDRAWELTDRQKKIKEKIEKEGELNAK